MIRSKQDLKKAIEWTPKSYVGKIGKEWVFYEKSWYCQTNYVIHSNINQLLNCPDCCKYEKKN